MGVEGAAGGAGGPRGGEDHRGRPRRERPGIDPRVLDERGQVDGAGIRGGGLGHHQQAGAGAALLEGDGRRAGVLGVAGEHPGGDGVQHPRHLGGWRARRERRHHAAGAQGAVVERWEGESVATEHRDPVAVTGTLPLQPGGDPGGGAVEGGGGEGRGAEPQQRRLGIAVGGGPGEGCQGEHGPGGLAESVLGRATAGVHHLLRRPL